MWDQFIELVNKNAGAIAVVIISAIAGALLTKFLPWFGNQLGKLANAITALVGGNWHDYRFERQYLNWLIGRHRFLGQLPSNVAVATGEQKQLAELEKVYVALAITTGGASSEMPREEMDLNARRLMGRGEQKWWWRFIPIRWRPDAARPYSNIGRAVEQSPRLVIRGNPGSGKTTLMKYLAVTCARALRNSTREGDQSLLVYERLGWKDRPFPIFVSLGRHGNVKSWDKGHGLIHACGEEFGSELDDCPNGFFERRLKRGGCLILLDAYDELGSREARQKMAEYISGLLNKFPDAKNRVIVTTRIVGYEGQLDERGFVVQTVQPLTDSDIQALVKQRYRAIAVQEGAHRSESETELAQRRNANKADQLLKEIKRNTRLHDLAKNPLLLSLIVLDHSVKLVLPEDRHILYRDCVEILAARWRQAHRAELNVTADDGELSLTQKIDLLQVIALEMQKQRTQVEAGQIPIRRTRAEELIAEQLPNMLAALPSDATQKRILCQHKATAWLDGIKIESGILIELGLDDAGEPVLAFSHLTFQEYLAASLLKEQASLYTLLQENLLNPAWEEVLLLYTGISQEATALVRELLAQTPTKPGAWFIAGRVLTERTTVGETERQQVLNGLHRIVLQGELMDRQRACEILGDIGSPQSKPVLVQVVEHDTAWKARYTAAQVLGEIGDPRFERTEPEMVTVPAGEFVMGDGERQHQVNVSEYRIGKYPVTNAEYKQFADETGHRIPNTNRNDEFDWETEKHLYPQGKANHPVVRVSWDDAQVYCEWLSKKTGRKFRLPTEAEWEKAARGVDGREYPWGKEFDKDKCNTSESGIGTTTPVGIYLEGASVYGALDMSGNVWEWCNSLYRKYPYSSADGREVPSFKEPTGLKFYWAFIVAIIRSLRNEDRVVLGWYRIVRGGSWSYFDDYARCASRLDNFPVNRYYYLGFRVAESSPGFGSVS